MVVYLLAIGSAFLYGAADFTGGLTTRRAGTIPVVLLSQFSGLALLVLLLPLLPPSSATQSDFLWGGIAGLAGGIGVALLYRALSIGVMAVVAPTTAVCAVTIPVVYSLLRGERPAPLAVVGIVLGITSIILVSQQRSHADTGDRGRPAAGRLPVGVGTALVSGVAIGFFFLGLAQTDPSAGMWPLVASRSVSVTLFAAVAVVRHCSLRMPGRVLTLVLLAGTIDMLANALYLIAAQQGPLSIVVTLSSLYPASTVLLARLVLHERLNLLQITGVGCALAAVVLIVSGGW
jgi:drug/metabolite transporter (DMT)-like permease